MDDTTERKMEEGQREHEIKLKDYIGNIEEGTYTLAEYINGTLIYTKDIDEHRQVVARITPKPNSVAFIRLEYAGRILKEADSIMLHDNLFHTALEIPLERS